MDRAWTGAGRDGSTFEQILQIVIMVVIQTQHGQPLPVASHFPSYHAVLATVTSLQCETTVGPQLSLGAETVWRLQQRDWVGEGFNPRGIYGATWRDGEASNRCL